jgi:uncharacterized protein YlaN (UPF0358 family)
VATVSPWEDPSPRGRALTPSRSSPGGVQPINLLARDSRGVGREAKRLAGPRTLQAMKRPLQTLSLGLLLAAAASAQGGEVGLARVRATFQKADASGDGKLDAKEATKAGIPAGDVRRLDHDKDGSLSGDEFLLYYRQLLSRAGRKAAKDLEDEAARILAARKQATDGARRRGQGDRPAPKPEVTPAPGEQPAPQPQPELDSETARAADLVRRAVRSGRVQASEGAEVLALLEAKGEQDAPTLREQHRRARARIQAMTRSGVVSADQGRQLMNAIGRRLQQAGVQPAPEPAPEVDAPPVDPVQPPAEQGPAPVAQTESQRAAVLVRTAVRSGRIQAAQGDEVLALLESKGPQDADSLRTQHRKARARIQAMAQAGAVTPEEGRQLMNAIGRRLQQAGVTPAPEEAGDQGEPAPQPAPEPVIQSEYDRAAALVRLAVRSGRVQASEGAEVLELLESKGAQDADSLRTQHRKARARIQAMAQAGVVTPEQGRQLMNAIGRRLQQAGVQPADPEPAQRGGEDGPAPRPEVRPAPKPQPKPQEQPQPAPGARGGGDKPAPAARGGDAGRGPRPAARPQEAPKPARRPAVRKPVDPPASRGGRGGRS